MAGRWVLFALALGGCTLSPHQRVQTALVEAGVPDPIADCMAGRMTKRLSVNQLMELRYLSHADNDEGRFSPGEFVRRLVEIDDPEVVSVTATAALRCTIAA